MTKKPIETAGGGTPLYTAKITDAKEEFIISDNAKVMDITFDILKDGKVVAERRLNFPLGTAEEDITQQIKDYLKMYEGDYAGAEKAAKAAEVKEASDKVLNSLKGREL
jgi:hypothetical protein